MKLDENIAKEEERVSISKAAQDKEDSNNGHESEIAKMKILIKKAKEVQRLEKNVT